jgi:predicted NAD-dependent protein-ADP-ribosyltransferase YbiA (DUF1768 family)
MKNRQYWSGTKIDKLEDNDIFVFGSNPTGLHGAGGALFAKNLYGAEQYVGRGLTGRCYALVTKNLKAGFYEKETNITYDLEGFKSISVDQIKKNIDELYEFASNHPDKRFLITFQYETWDNGAPKKSLNGYTSEEMFQMFIREAIPSNIVFHDSYKDRLENLFSIKNENKDNKEYHFFFHLKSPFSNFYPSKFTYKDITFISNEQFMMYCKAKSFADEETAQNIIENLNNVTIAKDFIDGKLSSSDIVNNENLSSQWNTLMSSIKQEGRKVKNYDDNIWTAKRFKIVYFGARLKFSQNEDLMQSLINIGNKYFVEASPYDKIWGIGLSEFDAKKTPPEKWLGQNLLGKVLDKLKLEFKNENKITYKV